MKFWRVTGMESESFLGHKVEDVSYFLTHEEANFAAQEVNKRNKEAYAPDIYVRANVDTVEVDDKLVDLIVTGRNPSKRKPAKK